jgi:hypothetical protein
MTRTSDSVRSGAEGAERTASDRHAELSKLFSMRLENRLRQDILTIAAESGEPWSSLTSIKLTERVTRALQRIPVLGKEVVYSCGPGGPWGIGRIVRGEPGNLVRLPQRFDSYHDAFNAIMAARWSRLKASIFDS